MVTHHIRLPIQHFPVLADRWFAKSEFSEDIQRMKKYHVERARKVASTPMPNAVKAATGEPKSGRMLGNQ